MKNKLKIYFFVVIFLMLGAFPALAQVQVAEQAGGGILWIGEGFALNVTQCLGDQYVNGNAFTQNMADCIANLIKNLDENTQKTIKAYMKKRLREEWWDQMKDKLRESMAGAFKKSLENMARQIGRDTAVWVASGGRGQKPLFITEGWGAYMKNMADVALGDFIDQIGQSFGVDLCEPNFDVKLAIILGIDQRQTRRVRCSFSKIINNWESAISNANFSIDYQVALRPGENDISVALMLADKRNSYVAGIVEAAAKEAETQGLWSNIKDIAGKILTPGSMIHDKFKSDIHDTSKLGWETFTDTIWDLLGSFLDTLVAQLALNLKNGFFSSNYGNDKNNININLESLFTPWSSPIVAGIKGAEDKFDSLKLSKINIGGYYDLLTKLSTCQDPNNPGPTDCVLDQDLASAIRQKVLVKDLPESILNRPFSSLSNKSENPKDYFSLRGVTILRKYRIVPIGWEYAAKMITDLGSQNPNFKTPALKEIMNNFYNENSNYFGLIDPYWVLKAPEMFCRREGFGPQNSFSNDQEGAIFRNNYCADEQQCLKEDDNGSCITYGYCSEERKIWNFGKSCEERYNTCNTYVNRAGQTNYWLTNTLDFRDCDQSVVGCRWFSTEYNPVSQYWVGSNEGKFYQVNNTSSDQTVIISSNPIWWVKEGQYVSNNKRLIMSSPCSETLCKDPAMNGKCSVITTNNGIFCQIQENLSCKIPVGGINCRLPICDSQEDAFKLGNGGFEDQEGNFSENAKKWSDELSFISNNNRAYREEKGGKTGAGLRILANGTPSAIVLNSDPFAVKPGSAYHLKFDIRGSISNRGKLSLFVYGGDKKITSNDLSDIKILTLIEIGASNNWNIWTSFRSPEFKVQDFATATMGIIVSQGSFADIKLDNFSLNEVSSKCFENSVTVFSEIVTENSETIKDIYFDRDAQVCSENSVGCSQFLRLKGGVGTNLIYNGGFEYGDSEWSKYWKGDNPIVTTSDSRARLKYSPASYSEYRPINVESGSYYAVSFDASQIASGNSASVRFEMIFVEDKSYAGNIPLHKEVIETNCTNIGKDDKELNFIFTPNSTIMERKSCWFKVPDGAKVMMFKPFAVDDNGNHVYFDNLKIEKVIYPAPTPTPYTSYDPGEAQSSQVTYLKKAPDCFNCYYYKKNGSNYWPQTPEELNSVLAGRSLACSQFAGVCIPSEVGCELYKPLNGDPTVPGVVNDIDVCPQECAGYQVYKQESTRFVNDKYRQFIADEKVKYCSASYVGCDEFTNLDELGRGAEVKEYYSAIRACQKPDIDDGAYYTWEGSDTSGYQLKAYNLKKSNSTDPDPNSSSMSTNSIAPCVNLYYDTNGKSKCNDPVNWSDNPQWLKEAGFCTINDLVTNPDCRQFYDVFGNVHYRLLSRTVSVSNNCHPYRRTVTQNSIEETKEDCQSHNGWWKEADKECIYMAIPGEGMKCPASVKGCRAYTGNRGNNVRNIIEVANFGLQSSTTGGWVGADGTPNGLFVSSESTFPGGNSLTNKNTVTIKHPVKIKKGKTYVLSFWAKGTAINRISNFTLDSIKFSGATSISDYFAVKQVEGDNLISTRPSFNNNWNLYELGPVFVDWDPSETEYLEFNLPTVNGVTGYNIYLDNVILKEVVNKVYAIENSWYTPVSCDNKLDDPDGSKSRISRDCQDSFSGRCFIGEMLGCAGYTTRDQRTVYLKSFASLCRPEAAGCEALIDIKNNSTPLAKSYHEGDASEVRVPADEQIYMVNSPDFTCPSSDKGCSPYGLPIVDQQDNTVGYQSVFIKNQPDRYETDLCYAKNLWCEEYSNNGGARYFKEPHNKICVYGTPVTSTVNLWYKLGTNGDPCSTTLNQTYGKGYGSPENKRQPVGVVAGATYSSSSEPTYSGWVGACPQSQSGCTEFVDPLTEIYITERGKVSDSSTSYVLKANTLYSISSGNGSKINITSNDCSFIPQEASFSVVDSDSSGYLYYTEPKSNNSNCNVNITPTTTKVVRAGVYYKLADSVNKSDCNGLVDFSTGCVLFNDRNGVDYSTTTMVGRNRYLNFDANYTYSTQGFPLSPRPVRPKTAQEAKNAGRSQSGNNTDVILKVKPDRTCSEWLSCVSYIKGDGNTNNEKFGDRDYCLNVKACDELGSDNQCSHFVYSTTTILNLSGNDYKNKRLFYLNKTGYSIPGLYPVDQMDYLGQGAIVGNGNFETVLPSGKPLSWNPWDSNQTWNPSLFSIISDSKNAPEGKNYLRVNFKNTAVSEAIDIIPKQQYYLSAWINTKFLKSSSSSLKERAEIVIMNRLNDSEITRIMVSAGLDWSRQTINFSSSTNSIYLLLRNSPDFDSSNNGQPVGYSLFDDIQIAPVLKIGEETEEPKTCRIYPSSDAPSCKYKSGNIDYYGWYGYCLTPDPINRNNCLQWFPVDKIKGELSSDYPLGYDNRRPLYYCIDWDIVSFNISDFGMITNVGADVGPKNRQKYNFIEDNRKMTFETFYINPEYAEFLRYPYIDRFIFNGLLAGLDDKHGIIPVPVKAEMRETCVKVKLFGFFKLIFGYCNNNVNIRNADLKVQAWENCVAPYIRGEQTVSGISATHTAFWLDKLCSSGKINNISWSGEKIGGGGSPSPSIDVDYSKQESITTNNYYGIGGIVNDRNFVPLSSTNTIERYYDCFNYKPFEEWDYDQDNNYLHAKDFCDNSDFCKAYNNDATGTAASTTDCKNLCNDVLSSTLDNEIESCIAKYVKEEKAGKGKDFFDKIRNFYQDLITIEQIWTKDDEWGGFGIIGFSIKDLGWPIIFPTTWSWAFKITNIEPIINALLDLINKGMVGYSISAIKIITDEDTSYKNQFVDPNPQIPGNILGFAWYLNTSDLLGAGLFGNFSGYLNIPYCKRFIQVVNSSGQNKAYYSRVGLGSTYTYTVPEQYYNDNGIKGTTSLVATLTYDTDYMPFGALVPPSNGNIDEPITWDSKVINSIKQGSINLPGVEVDSIELIRPVSIGLDYPSTKQPLFFEAPILSYQAPYQARAGSGGLQFNDSDKISRFRIYLNRIEDIKNLFARSYRVFEWRWEKVDRYREANFFVKLLGTIFDNSIQNNVVDCVTKADQLLGSEYKICSPKDNAGGEYQDITNNNTSYIWDDVNSKGTGSIIFNVSSTIISKNNNVSLVKLTFNVEANPNQLPIKSYLIAWGDGTVDSVSGAFLNDKANPKNPFTVYHTYDYNKLKEVSGSNFNLSMPCCYKVNDYLCNEKPFFIHNTPDLNNNQCNKDGCAAIIYISVRDNWDKVNYCDPKQSTIGNINSNFTSINITSN